MIGIEFARELHEAALKNPQSWRWERKSGSIELVWGDALEFEFPAEPSVVFIHNPFRPALLSRVLENVQRSVEAHPRELLVIYYQPNYRSAIQAMPNLLAIADSECYNFAIYQLKTAADADHH